MRSGRGVTVALTVVMVAVVLAGCTATTTATGAATTTATGAASLKTFTTAGLSFRYPGTWHAEPWGDNPAGTFETPVVYLSTARLLPPCATSGSETTCGAPVATLPPGAIVVTWAAVGMPTASPIVSAPNTTIARRSAQVSVSASMSEVAQACTGLDASQSVSAEIQLSPPDNELTMVACLRGPGTAGHLSEVTAMLRSVTVTPG